VKCGLQLRMCDVCLLHTQRSRANEAFVLKQNST
jgi:hypothetical protein